MSDTPAEAVSPRSLTVAPVIIVTPAHPGVDATTCAAALVVGCQEAGMAVRVGTLVRVVSPAPPSTEATPAERVAHLTGAEASTVHTLAGEPRGPGHPPTLARRQAVALTPAVVHAALVARMARTPGVDLVVIDDALGLLVPLDADGATLLDVADSVTALGVRVGFVLATGDGRDDMAPTLLAAEVLRSRGRDVLGLAVHARGASPSAEDVAVLAEASGLTLLGVVPSDAPACDPQTFQDRAGAWLPVT